jgi:uncharacterized HAD superfamily protein
MKRQVIAVDIDDVLSASVEGMVAYSNERWGMHLTPEDYTEAFAVFWGVTEDEAINQRIPEMLGSGLFGRHRCIENAPEVLALLQQKYNLVAVTSRRKILQPDTDMWLARHLPGVFREVHYVGIWDGPHEITEALKRDKTAICKQLGAEYLIDDHEKHCVSAASAGIETILFGDYKWNRDTVLLPNMTRAKDWKAVAGYFNVES